MSNCSVGEVPLIIKFSSSYFRCPCRAICVPKRLEILVHRLSPTMSYLSLSEFHLNIYNAKHNQRGILLEQVFIRSIDFYPKPKNSTISRCFAINAYEEHPGKIFTIYCRTNGENEALEWQRALLIFQRRQMNCISDIIDMYLSL